jgi:hypothetical protein
VVLTIGTAPDCLGFFGERAAGIGAGPSAIAALAEGQRAYPFRFRHGPTALLAGLFGHLGRHHSTENLSMLYRKPSLALTISSM